MSAAIFYWVGVFTIGVLCTVGGAAALFSGYAFLIHDRFNCIFFRAGERRLSIASWYSAKLMNDELWKADDFPIGRRPFYLSYRIGEQRLFLMLGIHEGCRHMPIQGKHPETHP